MNMLQLIKTCKLMKEHCFTRFTYKSILQSIEKPGPLAAESMQCHDSQHILFHSTVV